MSSLYAMPAELAKPVACGHLPITRAYAAMLASTVAAERCGQLAPYKAPDVFRLQKHLIGQHLDRLETRRDLAAHRIKRLIGPMLMARKRSNAILAEAHGHNGQAGFPLTEDEVTDIVRQAMYWAMPREVRHG